MYQIERIISEYVVCDMQGKEPSCFTRVELADGNCSLIKELLENSQNTERKLNYLTSCRIARIMLAKVVMMPTQLNKALFLQLQSVFVLEGFLRLSHFSPLIFCHILAP